MGSMPAISAPTWLEGFGDWAWPGLGPAVEVGPAPWVPALPVRIEPPVVRLPLERPHPLGPPHLRGAGRDAAPAAPARAPRRPHRRRRRHARACQRRHELPARDRPRNAGAAVDAVLDHPSLRRGADAGDAGAPGGERRAPSTARAAACAGHPHERRRGERGRLGHVSPRTRSAGATATSSTCRPVRRVADAAATRSSTCSTATPSRPARSCASGSSRRSTALILRTRSRR